MTRPLGGEKLQKCKGIQIPWNTYQEELLIQSCNRNLKNKATRALYALRSKVNVNNLPITIALKLYDTLIKPILHYASEVCEPFVKNEAEQWDQSDIEKVYTQFLKQLLGVNRSTTTTAMARGELNRHSLQEEILRRNIKYARYIYNKEDHYFVKQAYQ